VTLLLALLLSSADARSVRDTYQKVVDTGCDPSEFVSPAVVRVLRNTPFAIAGRPFTSTDLDALFRADGDWYAPKKGEVHLSETDSACVAKLKAHEDKLRSMHCVTGDAQAALTAAPDIWLWHYQHQFDKWDITGKAPAKASLDACKPPDFQNRPKAGHTSSWTIEVGAVKAGMDVLRLPAAISNTYTDAQSPESLAAANAMIAAWLKAGKGVRYLKGVADSEDWDGDEAYESQTTVHCAGPDPFMSEQWICFGYSMP